MKSICLILACLVASDLASIPLDVALPLKNNKNEWSSLILGYASDWISKNKSAMVRSWLSILENFDLSTKILSICYEYELKLKLHVLLRVHLYYQGHVALNQGSRLLKRLSCTAWRTTANGNDLHIRVKLSLTHRLRLRSTAHQVRLMDNVCCFT
jgi:hypothetical protein